MAGGGGGGANPFAAPREFVVQLPREPKAHDGDVQMLRDLVYFGHKVIRESKRHIPEGVQTERLHKSFDYEIVHHVAPQSDYYGITFRFPFNVAFRRQEHLNALANFSPLHIQNMLTFSNPYDQSQQLLFEFHSLTRAPPQLDMPTVVHLHRVIRAAPDVNEMDVDDTAEEEDGRAGGGGGLLDPFGLVSGFTGYLRGRNKRQRTA